jgi:TatD DNase family protein
MEFIDTHAHINDLVFDQDRDQVIKRSIQAGVSKIYLPNIDMTTIESMLEVEAKYPQTCAAMIGIHPCHILDDFEQQLVEVENWLSKRRFAAIGEVGIDLYRDQSYQIQQQEAFATQIAWAKQYQLPLIIHCRNAFEETLQLLETHQDGSLKGIFHCFSGNLAEAKRIIELGFYLGIGGVLTFKNAGLAEVVGDLVLEHLVLETDSPYLAPAPYRGKRNEPSYLPYVAAHMASIYQVETATVAAITTANAKQVFETKDKCV